MAQRISVAPLPSPAGPNSAEPFITSADGKNLTLSWLQRAPDSSSVTLHVATLDSSQVWSPAAEVVKASNLFVNWADFPSVVTLANGHLLAHWLQKSGSAKYAYDIQLAQSADAGRTWTPAGMPHPAGVPVEHGFVSLLPRPDTTADIVFLSGTLPPPNAPKGFEAPFHLSLARFEKSGKVTDSVVTLDAQTCTCCQTAATMTSKGAVVLYRDRSDKEIRDNAVVRHVDGAWTSPAPLHADNWEIAGCPVNGPAIAAVGDTVAAVWFTGAHDTSRVQLKFSTDAGVTFGAPVRIDAGRPLGRLDVKLITGGDALVTWTEQVSKDSAEVRARLVRIDGTLEPEFRISTVASGRASGFPRMARTRKGVALAWTVPGTQSTVQVAELTIAPR